jgi:hypothetical protein
MPKNLPSDDVQKMLKTVYDFCVAEDESSRQRQIRQWRKLKLLWEGFSQVWFSEVAHDWRVWDQISASPDSSTDQAAYDRPINIFRAYLESIIAALSVTVPPVKCFPDNADDTLDLSTARAGDKIGQLVYRHNDAPLKWLHALFIFVTEGCTAFYNYVETDEKYGTYENKDYEEIEESENVTTCPTCGFELSRNPVDGSAPNPQAQLPPAPQQQQLPPGQPQGPPQPTEEDAEKLRNQEMDEYNPDDEDAKVQYNLLEGQELCPACMQMMDPELTTEKFITTRLAGVTHEPKSRICIEVYGGLNVRIPNYAKKQCDVPYLILSLENNYVTFLERYPHLIGNKGLTDSLKSTGRSATNMYEQWGRLNPQYQGEYPINVVTENRAWLRPCSFNCLPEDDAKKLKKLYPNGAKVVFVADQMAAACNESLDDHWTLTENPMSDYLSFMPLGQSLDSVQEITNDMISLILQTIEHGIGQTFADPGVVNFNAYEQTEVVPGGIFPATPKSGKSMGDGFYELRTATLSSEIMPFYQQVQSAGQITSGALPSIFGGQIEGSDTASEYSMSRAQALQRLQNTWKLFTTTWKTMFSKVVPMYIQEVQYDEREVQRTDDGNFINSFIYRADLEGKIGRIELEANENLPMTWGQKKDLLMALIQNPNPIISQILQAPENLSIVHEALGLTDYYVPGEDDVIKTYDDIKTLLNGQPIPTADPMNPMVSSVEVDPDMDNHQIAFEVCRKWAISETGRQAKTLNPAGYQNVLLYAKENQQIIQQNMMAQQQQELLLAQAGGKGATPPAKSNPKTAKEAPITGEDNVQAVH